MKKAILVASVLLINSWSALTQAQVQVVEPGAAQAQSRAGGAPAGGNDLLVSLYNQLEALQQEVQTLRGMVEEQSNRLRRLETESRDRYLDMDSRLSALSGGAAAPAPVPADPSLPATAAPGTIVDTPAGDVRTSATFNAAVQGEAAAQPPAGRNLAPAGAGNIAAPAGTAAPAPAAAGAATVAVDAAASQMSEQDLYRNALNLLLEEGKSEESAAMFSAYLQRFPQGRLLPNALYWQGEALILLARYPEAKTAFDRVMNEFPTDAKAAGAMLKTGVVQNLMGNRGEAERIWRELPSRFPDSASEITLARDYLSRP